MAIPQFAAPKEAREQQPHARQSYFGKVLWRWSDALPALAPAVLPRLFALLPLSATVLAGARVAVLPASLIIECWMLIYPLQIAVRRVGALPRLPRPRTIFVEGLIAVVTTGCVLVAMMLSTSAFQYFFGGDFSTNAPFAPLARSFSRVEVVGFAVLIILVTPIAEEVLFRGMLYNALRRRLGPALAVLTSAALFGLAHPFGLADSVAIVLVGVHAPSFMNGERPS